MSTDIRKSLLLKTNFEMIDTNLHFQLKTVVHNLNISVFVGRYELYRSILRWVTSLHFYEIEFTVSIAFLQI